MRNPCLLAFVLYVACLVKTVAINETPWQSVLATGNQPDDVSCPQQFRQGEPENFQKWLRENGQLQPNGDYKTTLEAELLLARRLYDEAEGLQQERVLSIQETIQELQGGTFMEGDLVRWKGISVDWFLHVFSKTKFVQGLIEFDCQLWFVRKVCIIELLICKGAYNSGALIDHVESLFLENIHSNLTHEVTKEPTAFLSYTGR